MRRPMAGIAAGVMALAHVLTTATATSAAPAPQRAAAPAGYDATRCGNTSSRVLLTFDDWPYADPDRATRTGAYLHARKIRAAFFLIGEYAGGRPDIVTTLREQGHWVANHSFSHPRLPALSDDEVRMEISSGVRSNMLRPPYGAFGAREESEAAALGYRICTWTVDTLDWEQPDGAYRSVASIRSIVRNAPVEDKYGGVVLGHLDYNFPDAVPGIIDDLEKDGYQLCRNNGPVSVNAPLPLDCG
ncbi:polysaccharide deacetylase family protein [Streptomyces sp. NPDC051776]|uniref:polysaccharide deacetylase family protein n=1 Tax=Streptomyces sp. NPDC051776 TaxID=3155414 RepID=UPI00343B26D9